MSREQLLSPSAAEALLTGKLRHLLTKHFRKQKANPEDIQHYESASSLLQNHSRAQIREMIQLLKYERQQREERSRVQIAKVRKSTPWINAYREAWRAFAATQVRTGDDASEVRACAEHALSAADKAMGLT